MAVPSGHNSLSLTGSEPSVIGSGTTTPGSSSSQGPKASNQFLGKGKIRDLVSQHRVICSMLLRKLTKQYCNKKKNWHLTVPGFSSEDKQHHSEHMPTMMEASPKAEISTSSITKETVRPGLGDHVGSNDIIEPPISEELASPSNDQI
ncbi:putative family membrane protein-like [Capsicum annuum]|nr:putative family membrane protein-like [Capsicum annuum]